MTKNQECEISYIMVKSKGRQKTKKGEADWENWVWEENELEDQIIYKNKPTRLYKEAQDENTNKKGE